MARWAAALWVLSATACFDKAADRAQLAVQFREPTRVVVEAGDTLGSIAERFDVTADDLIAWNNLESDHIEPGDMVFVWEVAEERLPDPTAFLEERDDSTNRRVIGRAAPAQPPPSRAAQAQPTTPETATMADAGGVAATGAPPEANRPTSVRNSGIFAADVEGSNDGLADAVAGLQDSRGGAERDRVRNTSMRPQTADTSDDLDVRVKDLSTGPSIPNTPVRTPRLSRPAAKRCLTQNVGASAEEGMYGGDGLTSGAIKSSLKRTLGVTRKCLPPGSKGNFKMIVEFKVGCDGRVKNVYTINDAGLPPTVTACIESVLSSTGFPAHDMPDGQSFQYPIHYNF